MAPTITSQRASETVVSGQATTLTVVASGSDLIYQWFSLGRPGRTTSPIAGAMAEQLYDLAPRDKHDELLGAGSGTGVAPPTPSRRQSPWRSRQ